VGHEGTEARAAFSSSIAVQSWSSICLQTPFSGGPTGWKANPASPIASAQASSPMWIDLVSDCLERRGLQHLLSFFTVFHCNLGYQGNKILL
jgi:hypothetical protein